MDKRTLSIDDLDNNTLTLPVQISDSSGNININIPQPVTQVFPTFQGMVY